MFYKQHQIDDCNWYEVKCTNKGCGEHYMIPESIYGAGDMSSCPFCEYRNQHLVPEGDCKFFQLDEMDGSPLCKHDRGEVHCPCNGDKTSGQCVPTVMKFPDPEINKPVY